MNTSKSAMHDHFKTARLANEITLPVLCSNVLNGMRLMREYSAYPAIFWAGMTCGVLDGISATVV